MKSILKILAGVIFIVAVVVTGVVLYGGRSQEIDFAVILPDKLEHCGKMIDRNTAEYAQLKKWLETNKSGWQNTPASYAPHHTYTSPNISINILADGVVINYKTKNGNWSQVSKSKGSKELLIECTKANKSLKSGPRNRYAVFAAP